MDDHVLKLIHKRFHELDRDNSGFLDKEDFIKAPLAKDITLHSSTVTPIFDVVLLRNEPSSPTEFLSAESESASPTRAYSSSIHDPVHMKHASDPPAEEELSPRPTYHASQSLEFTFHSLEGSRRASKITGVPLQVDEDIEHLRHSQGGLQSLPPPVEEEAVSPLMKLFGRRESKRVVFDEETIAALGEAHQRRNDLDASALDSSLNSSHGSKSSDT